MQAQVGELTSEVHDRLIAESGGNPLALQDLPGALTSEQLAGRAPLPDRLDLGTRLQQVFLQQVRGLPEATRRLLLVAAAEDTGQLATVLAAVPGLGIGPEALEAAEQVLESGGHTARCDHHGPHRDQATRVPARAGQVRGRRQRLRDVGHPDRGQEGDTQGLAGRNLNPEDHRLRDAVHDRSDHDPQRTGASPPNRPSTIRSLTTNTAWRSREWRIGRSPVRRPSDDESKSLRPAGAVPAGSGCSHRRDRLLSAFQTCGVMAGGMTKRMTRPTQGSPMMALRSRS
jgi:hypothetical protein